MDCPTAPLRQDLPVQDAYRLPSAPILRDVSCDELSDEIRHLIGVEAALGLLFFCLRITARSPLGEDTLSLHAGLKRSHLTVFADRVLSGVPAIPCRSILDQKSSPASRCDLQA